MLPAGSAGPQASRQADLFTQHGQLADIGQRVRPGGDNHLDGGHELVQEVLVAVELLGIAGRLVPTAQEHAGEDLPRHVTVLAPRADLVVAEVRCRSRPGRHLAVAVGLELPVVGDGGANRSAAVEQRQRTADPAGDPTRRSLSGVMVEAGSQPVGPGARAVVRTPCP